MAHEENKAFLRRVPLFSSLTEAQLEGVAAGSARRSYPRGRTIVAEGEASQSMYIVSLLSHDPSACFLPRPTASRNLATVEFVSAFTSTSLTTRPINMLLFKEATWSPQ